MKRTAVWLAAALGMAAAQGAVVAHYRMEGDWETGEVTNSVTGAGAWGKATMMKHSNSSPWFVEPAESFATEGVGMEGGETVANRIAARFRCGTKEASTGAYLTIADSAEVRLESFTIEAFVKYDTETVEYNGSWRGIFLKSTNLASTDSWGVRVLNSSTMHMRFHDEANTKTEVMVTGVNPLDGKWHHVALSFDGATKKATLFWDWAVKAEKTLAHAIYYNGQPVCIGGNNRTPACWHGWIDEVRVSDRALGAAELLRPKELMSVHESVAEDVFVHFRLDGAGDFGVDPRLPVKSGETPPAVRANGSTGWPQVAEEAAYSPLYTGPEAEPVRNAGAMRFRKPDSVTVGAGLEFREPQDAKISDADFTAECIFKVEGTAAESYKPLLRQPSMANVCWNLGIGEGGVIAAGFCEQGHASEIVQVVGPNMYAPEHCGKWHHAALVFRRAEREFELWLDYVLIGRRVLQRFGCEPFDPYDTNPEIYLGATTANNAFGGLIDEARITRRALAPQEFLSPRRTPLALPAGTTLGYWPMDRDGGAGAELEPLVDGALDVSGGVEHTEDVKQTTVYCGKEIGKAGMLRRNGGSARGRGRWSTAGRGGCCWSRTS